MHNRFTFTSLYELVRFTSHFTASAAKMQHLRLMERVDDYPITEHRAKSIAKARRALGTLTSLTLHIYLSDWSAYDERHTDGYINELIHLHAHRPCSSFKSSVPAAAPSSCSSYTTLLPIPNLSITVRPRGRHNHTPPFLCLSKLIEDKLYKVFRGEYGHSVKDIPMSDPPPMKVREDEKPLVCRKGILALGD